MFVTFDVSFICLYTEEDSPRPTSPDFSLEEFWKNLGQYDYYE